MSPFEEVGDGKLVNTLLSVYFHFWFYLSRFGGYFLRVFFLSFGGILSLGLWFDSVRVYGHFCVLYVGLTWFERGFIWISTRVMVSG